MPKSAKPVPRDDPRLQLVVEAWRKLRPNCGVPDEITTLKRHKHAGCVFRLGGAGPAGSAVIAKRCTQEDGHFERTIYTEILPKTPVTFPEFYGYLEEPESPYSWIFLEDVGTELFSENVEEHRALAARWLALLHVSAAENPLVARLPDRGPEWYFKILQSTRKKFAEAVNLAGLDLAEREVLEDVVAKCDLIDLHWSHLLDCVASVSPTLTHNDFVPKNIGVRRNGAENIILPYDWEKSGWAVPAADLENIDLVSYCSVIRNYWSYVDRPALDRLASAGRVFRLIVSVNWTSWALDFPCDREKSIQKLVVYNKKIEGAINELVR